MSIVVFTPGNMNAIDGSAVWAQSTSLALAGVQDVEVTLLLAYETTSDRMLRPVLDNTVINVVDPFASNPSIRDPLTPRKATRLLAELAVPGPQAFVVRGLETAYRLTAKRALKGKLWPYLTDFPQRVEDIDDRARRKISKILSTSQVVLCQTDELLSFLEAHVPAIADKGRLFPPAIPDGLEPVILPAPTSSDLRLCYSGKFARKWMTLEMCDLPGRLAERGITARVTMVGDKVNRDEEHPWFVPEMKRKLESSPGVEWVGGVSRERSIELMSSAHMGLSWRSHEMDDSLELSTKVLEYCAAGTPPVLNRTPMHERLFGSDYPLFVDRGYDVVELIASVIANPGSYARAIDRVATLTADFTLEKATERLGAIVKAELSR